MNFSLSGQAIAETAPFDIGPSTGALVSFEGRVRNCNDGQTVVRLEYSAYEPLAVDEGRQVMLAALEHFTIIEAACIHRLGSLAVGDVAVRVWVAAQHRQDGFAACAWIIDQIKARVPIWKKEFYANGSVNWVEGAGSQADS